MLHSCTKLKQLKLTIISCTIIPSRKICSAVRQVGHVVGTSFQHREDDYWYLDQLGESLEAIRISL